MVKLVHTLCVLAALTGPLPVLYAGELDDHSIRKQIISESLRAYPGNCPCPYNVDRAGRLCGDRSAWVRRGGYSPICFAHEISDEQVREYRERQSTS